eukprot:scpid112789/ scgid10253/ 
MEYRLNKGWRTFVRISEGHSTERVAGLAGPWNTLALHFLFEDFASSFWEHPIINAQQKHSRIRETLQHQILKGTMPKRHIRYTVSKFLMSDDQHCIHLLKLFNL